MWQLTRQSAATPLRSRWKPQTLLNLRACMGGILTTRYAFSCCYSPFWITCADPAFECQCRGTPARNLCARWRSPRPQDPPSNDRVKAGCLAQDDLVSRISRKSINLLKQHFKDELSKDDWRLVVRLKKVSKTHHCFPQTELTLTPGTSMQLLSAICSCIHSPCTHKVGVFVTE